MKITLLIKANVDPAIIMAAVHTKTICSFKVTVDDAIIKKESEMDEAALRASPTVSTARMEKSLAEACNNNTRTAMCTLHPVHAAK